ncbi:MAG: CBS domain-containing protein [Elusimicrobia bacterium]|nr:CBS domain-containing protein [Elusimicrobiota bacterium]
MKKDYLDRYLDDDHSFHVVNNKFTEKNQGVQETRFSLGNGFIGSRGIMEENPLGTLPGTYIAGMYGRTAAQVEELINLPNPINFILLVEGEKFDIFTMKTPYHKRVLDMKRGIIVRKTVFEDAKKRRYLYQSARFLSMADPHICAMKISLKLLKGSASLAAICGIDDTVCNEGGLMQAKRRHFNTVKTDKEGYYDYTAYRTHHRKDVMSYGDVFLLDYRKKKRALKDRFYQFELGAGQEIEFTRLFSIYTSNDYSVKSLKRETMRTLNDATDKGFDALYREHAAAFSRLWNVCDVAIKGDYDIQKAMRFNIYHMLTAARKEYAACSIGAKTLSGPGYRGHIFWDTEIYLLPFYIYTRPDIARGLLLFRYNTLNQAREIARDKGYKGAMYPWEATTSGTEQTPRYSKDIDGRIVEVKTQDFEHHITADVAFGIYSYYRVTGDEEFMKEYGAEVIFETARFWTSRVSYDREDGKYHIRNVIGPDEFHVDVDDNAYTNYMASWNIRYAAELAARHKTDPAVSSMRRRIKLMDAEVAGWADIADNILILRSDIKGIIKQFKGYLKKKDYVVTNYSSSFLPLTPKHFEFEGLQKTSLIKQADVLLLFCLFPDSFSYEEKLANYRYYIYRTIHTSSLSYCMHSLLAAYLDDRFRAFVYFWMAVNTDLMDVPKNTVDGIHAANLGGVWQALLFGYAGIGNGRESLLIDPKLPGNIGRLEFSIYFRKDLYQIEESNKYVKIRFIPYKAGIRKKRVIKVRGEEVILTPYKYKTVKIREVGIKMITAKDVMKQKNLVTVTENFNAKKVGELLLERKISSVPVVNGKKELVGIISEKDFIKSASENERRIEDLKAADIMEKKVVSVNYRDSLESITKTFTEYPYRRLPVLKDGKVVGVITRRDIIADFLGGYY